MPRNGELDGLDLPDPKDFPADAPGSAAALASYVRGLITTVTVLNDRMAKSERNTTVTAVIVVLIALVGAACVLLGLQVAGNSACQARNFDAIKTYIVNARQSTNNKDDQAVAQLDGQIQLFTKVLDPTATTGERRDATLAYFASVKNFRDAILAGKQVRKDNPLPEGNCG